MAVCKLTEKTGFNFPEDNAFFIFVWVAFKKISIRDTGLKLRIGTFGGKIKFNKCRV